VGHGEVRRLRRVGNPRWEPANRTVGQFAENVLPVGQLRSPLNAKALAMKRVKRVMNLDYLGTMGSMFLSRPARGRLT
jgi:hypothetical protein